MAKYQITVDTDAKTFSATKDGVELSADDFTVGMYKEAVPCCCDSEQDELETYAYISYCTKDTDGSSLSRSVRFVIDGDEEVDESMDMYNMAREMSIVDKRFRAVDILSRNLAKKTSKNETMKKKEMEKNMSPDMKKKMEEEMSKKKGTC